MDYELIDCKDKTKWEHAFRKLPAKWQGVFFTSNFLEIFSEKMNGLGKCFFLQDGKNIAFYPFIKTRINNINSLKFDKEYYDIDVAPGYGGIFFSTQSENFKKEFHHKFNEYCSKESIIAQFAKSNPLYKNEAFFEKSELNNYNIIINLEKTIDELWKNSFGSSVRRNIKIAEKKKLTVEKYIPEEMTESLFKNFVQIYNSTMTRKNASENYYFDLAFIKKISQKLKKNIIFFFTILDNKKIACEMVLKDENYSYSFIAGSLKDYLKFKPNDILKFYLIKYLKKLKIKKYCIGGGVKINDGIFNYKKNYAKNTNPEKFFISKKIHNKVIFEKIKKELNLKDKNKFLFYRN